MAFRFKPEEEEFIIERFKRHKCLWHTRDEYYYDRQKRAGLLKELVHDFRDIFRAPVTETDIKKKWKNLRATYVREYKKVASPPSGTFYRSKWRHFTKLLFLDGHLNDDDFIDTLNHNTQNDSDSEPYNSLSVTPSIRVLEPSIRTDVKAEEFDDNTNDEDKGDINELHMGDEYYSQNTVRDNVTELNNCIAVLEGTCAQLQQLQERNSNKTISGFLTYLEGTLEQVPENRLQHVLLKIQQVLVEELESQ